MKTFTTKVIKNGRITIPKEIRQLLDIADGDMILVLDLKKVDLEATN